MAKDITQLPSLTVPANDDELLISDTSTASDKRITRSDFLKGAALPADTVTTTAIADGSVTPAKRSGGFKIVTIPPATLGTTGTKTVSGVGFTPKYIEVHTSYDASAAGAIRECTGYSDGTITTVRGFATSGSSQARWSSTTSIMNIRNEANTSLLVAGTPTFNSDGFTFNLTATDANPSAYSATVIAYA